MTFKSGKVYTISQAFEKAAKYCAIQDRCQSELKTKLLSWGLNTHEADEVLVILISEGYVNDERFAKSYVRGKFNQSKWGKIKIENGLKAKQISSYCIQIAIQEIEETRYLYTLKELSFKKWKLESALPIKKRVEKTARFLISRGFESHLVWDEINKLKKDD